MAYNSNINYAADLDYLMRTGAAGAATVNRLLNERMEKQQAAGENIYDDVYSRAMAYLLASGQDLVASDNVDYAAAANNILAGDAAQDGYYETLAAVLAQRDAKLGSGSYDEWKDAKTDDGYAYNGEGSLAEIMADYLMGKKLDERLAASSRPYLSGGYVNPGFGFDEYGNVVYDPEGMAESKRQIAADLKAAGYTDEAIAALGYGDAIESSGTAYGTSGAAAGGAGYTPREINELRRAARDNVGVTNAGTRAPVQGENSSYVEATTRNAYRDGLAALRESGDSRGAAALEADRANFEKTGRVGKVTMPEETERGPGTITVGGYGGASASSGGAAADTAQAEETPAASFQYSAAAYSPVGYETWLADILSPVSPGAVYDEESRRRGAGNLYRPAPSFGNVKKSTRKTFLRAPGGPQEIAFDDTSADPAYDENMKATYIIGYGPANEEEIEAMNAMGKLIATYEPGGRTSYVYDTTPKYRRTETVR